MAVGKDESNSFGSVRYSRDGPSDLLGARQLWSEYQLDLFSEAPRMVPETVKPGWGFPQKLGKVQRPAWAIIEVCCWEVWLQRNRPTSYRPIHVYGYCRFVHGAGRRKLPIVTLEQAYLATFFAVTLSLILPR